MQPSRSRFDLVVGLLPALLLWELLGRLQVSIFLPPFSRTVGGFFALTSNPDFLAAASMSLLNLLAGVALALSLGLVLGILMGQSRWIEAALNPFLNLLLVIPIVALIPILTLLFGLGRGGQISIIFMFAFTIVCITVYNGVKYVDPRLIEMATSFGTSRIQLLRHVVLPASAPMIITAVRQGINRAVRGMIIGEFLTIITGIGGLLKRWGSSFNMELLFAGSSWVILFSLIVVGALKLLERRAFFWHASGSSSE